MAKRKKKRAAAARPSNAADLEQFEFDSTARRREADPVLAGAFEIPAGLFEAQDAAEAQLELDEVDEDPSAFATRDAGVDRTNIVGTVIGEKEVGGRPTGELAIRYYVVQKVPPAHISEGRARRARELLEAHGGSVEATSGEVGTTVTVTLPL